MSIASRAIIPSPQRMIEIEGFVEDVAAFVGVVPPSIIKGIIWQESKFDEFSYRYNYNNPADRSYGLMHLTMPLAQEINPDEVQTYVDLYEPILNIWIGSEYLKKLYQRYGNWPKAIAAYNAGSPRYVAAGVFINQNYVNIVLRVANILKTSVIKALKLK